MAAPSRVAIIGLGIMGWAIARNLIAAGFSVSGFDVDAGKTARLATDGVVIRASAAEAARGAAVVLTSLPSTAALEATVASLIAAPQPGLIVVEVSTFPIECKEVRASGSPVPASRCSTARFRVPARRR